MSRSVALPRFGRKQGFQLARSAIIVFRVGLRLPLYRNIGPDLCIFSIQAKPILEIWFCIRLYCFRGTFRLANAAIDALVGVNDKHVLPFIEAVDRAYLDAIQIFALDTIFDHHIGHIHILATGFLSPSKVNRSFAPNTCGRQRSPAFPAPGHRALAFAFCLKLRF
jgi:hypothetical protein